MAVEASHITLLPPPNSGMMFQAKGDDRSKREKLLPVYGSGKTDSDSFKAVPLSRKRSCDSSSFNPAFCLPNTPNVDRNGRRSGEFTFLGEDISSQIYQQQMEIDGFIAHHNESVRLKIESMRKQNTRRLIAALHYGIMKRLKTKEEEIMKIGRLNWSLEERVKSLNVENQILKEMVQTNEATANALRNKLQQVLSDIQLQQHNHDVHLESSAKATTVLVDDVQSYCGSNYENEDWKETGGSNWNGGLKRWCRNCKKEESCVLLLPCRHLCVCSVCVSSVSYCPICNSVKSAGIHVNMSLS